MLRTIRQYFRKLKALQAEKGFGLVESLISVAILGAVVITLVVALSTGSIAVREGNDEVVAQRLARTQLEVIKGSPYDSDGDTYSTIDEPEGYSVTFDVDSTIYADTDIQKITVTISRSGEDILTVEDYKVNR